MSYILTQLGKILLTIVTTIKKFLELIKPMIGDNIDE